MKKKGFTLIELIVVIAIIGVLAAILVPAMLGYVRKSKITTANTSAKDIHTAFNVTLVDLDTADKLVDHVTGSMVMDSAALTGDSVMYDMIKTYFSDIESKSLTNWAASITAAGNCDAVAVMSGKYGGSYPNQMDVDTWVDNDLTDIDDLLDYAKTGTVSGSSST